MKHSWRWQLSLVSHSSSYMFWWSVESADIVSSANIFVTDLHSLSLFHGSKGSLFEKDYHGVADVEADVAAVVVRDWVTTFLDNEAVPITLVPSIEFFFDLASDVGKVWWIVVLKGFQARDDRRLLLVCWHVCSLY